MSTSQFSRAHEVTRLTLCPGDDYHVTFAAALRVLMGLTRWQRVALVHSLRNPPVVPREPKAPSALRARLKKYAE